MRLAEGGRGKPLEAGDRSLWWPTWPAGLPAGLGEALRMAVGCTHTACHVALHLGDLTPEQAADAAATLKTQVLRLRELARQLALRVIGARAAYHLPLVEYSGTWHATALGCLLALGERVLTELWVAVDEGLPWHGGGVTPDPACLPLPHFDPGLLAGRYRHRDAARHFLARVRLPDPGPVLAEAVREVCLLAVMGAPAPIPPHAIHAAARPATDPAVAEPAADGLAGDDGFRLGPHLFSRLTRLERSLLVALWGAGRFPEVELQDAARAVYADNGGRKAEALKQLHKRLADKLLAQSDGLVVAYRKKSRLGLRVVARGGAAGAQPGVQEKVQS